MTAIYDDLKNKIVFVTGGGSGIGASIVEHFCEQGAEVFFIDIDINESKKLLKSFLIISLALYIFLALL